MGTPYDKEYSDAFAVIFKVCAWLFGIFFAVTVFWPILIWAGIFVIANLIIPKGRYYHTAQLRRAWFIAVAVMSGLPLGIHFFMLPKPGNALQALLSHVLPILLFLLVYGKGRTLSPFPKFHVLGVAIVSTIFSPFTWPYWKSLLTALGW